MSELNAAQKGKRPDLAARNRSRHPHPIFPLGEDAGIKHCTKCCQDKPFDEFYLDAKNYSDGRRANCGECQKAASNLSYHTGGRAKQNARRKAHVAERYVKLEALKDVPCADCGGRFPRVCMDFDHVRGEKIDSISSMMRMARSWEIILAEIAKCQVVCANCHRIRTATRGRWYGVPAEVAV